MKHHKNLSLIERTSELLLSGKSEEEVLQVLKNEHSYREVKYLALAMELAKSRIRHRKEE